MTGRRIAIVESSAELGGAQLSLLPVAEALAARGPVVAYLPGPGPLAAALEARGVEVLPGFELAAALDAVSGSYEQHPSLAAVLGAGVHHQRRLRSSLRRWRPSVVYMNGVRAQMGATVPALAAGARVIWHIRDFRRPGALGTGWSALATATAAVVANSAATARQPGLRHVRRRVTTVHNGIDLARFVPAAEPGPGPGTLTIGMAAHLSPWKGHMGFLRLLARLRADVPELRGRIAGGDIYSTGGHAGYAERVRHELVALGLEGACTVEHVEPQDMPRWLQGVSVLVHCPERPEPFGRVLAEALACGVPVVAARAGGATEVLGDAGLLVAPGDEQQTIELVLGLLRDADRRRALAAAGRRRAEALFDERTYAARVVGIVG